MPIPRTTETNKTVSVRCSCPIATHNLPAVFLRDGLAVNKDPHRPNAWNVTHVRSGWALMKPSRTCDEAVALAEALLPLGDWQRSRTRVQRDTALREAVAAVYARVGAA